MQRRDKYKKYPYFHIKNLREKLIGEGCHKIGLFWSNEQEIINVESVVGCWQVKALVWKGQKWE